MPDTTTHPGFSGTVSYTAESLPDDNNLATARTIQVMCRYIREDAGSEIIRAALDSAVTPILRGNNWVTLMLVFGWVRNNVTFRKDPASAALMANPPAAPAEIELLIRPIDLLRMERPTGDCDDFSMLTAALLRTAGIPCQLVTIAADPEQPNDWSHVYVQAEIDGRAIALDASHGTHLGWEYPTPARKKNWPIDEGTQLGSMFPGILNAAALAGSTPTEAKPGTTGRIIEHAAAVGMDILRNRYGTAPAIQYKTRPDGSIDYSAYQLWPIPNDSRAATSISGSWLLLGLAAVAIVFVMKGNNG